MAHKILSVDKADLSPDTFAPLKPLLISRKEIIELMGEPPGTVDGFIRSQPDFPEKVIKGKYPRKQVMQYFAEKGML